MNVIVNIHHREALVVWTLPYVTSWRLSPDMLLNRLNDEVSKFPAAFNLDHHHGDVCYLPASQWGELSSLINKLEQDLNSLNLTTYDDRIKWLNDSIALFWNYESSYVWLDEFRQWYDGSFIKNYWATVENEDTALCFNPNLSKNHATHFYKYEIQGFCLSDKSPIAIIETVAVIQTEEPKPWLIADPRDPETNLPWYTAARYFARQLVIDDVLLLTKKPILAQKVVPMLLKAGYKKRGKSAPYDHGTVLKAFINVPLG